MLVAVGAVGASFFIEAAFSSALAGPLQKCSASTSLMAGTHVGTPATSESTTPMSAATIASTAAASDEFSTLAAAVEAAGLTDVLAGDGLLTVFAPTNAAFENLPEGVLESLLLPENQDQLVQILTYHVVPGAVTSDMLSAGPVETAAGSDVQIELTNEQITVNDATVIAADISASNGVIHGIDQVLLPPEIQ